MTWSETNFILRCDVSGVDHAVSVTTPFRYAGMQSAPLILCLDGAWTAGAMRDATRIMSMSGEAPEAIVAGLSFTDETMGDYLRSRARWYCPTQWVPPIETGVRNVEAEDMGRALTFLAFVRDQVLPRLAADFRVGERWLVGHSFSALFGLRTLFAEPDLFDKYLLASPSIWWDDRAILGIEAEYAAGYDDLAVELFVSAGEAEVGSTGIDEGGFNMRRNVEELVATLRGRGYRGLDLTYASLPTETHSSTIGAAFSRGLRALHTP